jgi:hypothetical protein
MTVTGYPVKARLFYPLRRGMSIWPVGARIAGDEGRVHGR